MKIKDFLNYCKVCITFVYNVILRLTKMTTNDIINNCKLNIYKFFGV